MYQGFEAVEVPHSQDQQAGRPVPEIDCHSETWAVISLGLLSLCDPGPGTQPPYTINGVSQGALGRLILQVLGAPRRPETDAVVHQDAQARLGHQSGIEAPLFVSLSLLLPHRHPNPSPGMKNSALSKLTDSHQTLGRWYACP